MGVCEIPFVILRSKVLFTFLRVLFTFLHVPPWFSKQFVSISYVPIRSVQTLRSFRKNVPFFLRSYTFCATVSQNVHFCLRSYTFRATVSHFVVVALVYVPTRSVYVPTRSAVVFDKNVHISYVPIRSEQPFRNFRKMYRFPYVPKRSVQQYRKSSSRRIIKKPCSTVSQKNAGGLNAHTHIKAGVEQQHHPL